MFSIRLMEHLVVPTFVIDKDHRVIIWNRACERLTGVAAEAMIHTSDHWKAFYAERRPCLADYVATGDYEAIRHSGDWESVGLSDFGACAEAWCLMPALGHRLYVAIDAGPIYGETGDLIAVIETVRDITAQKETQILLEDLAAKDSLTGLSNRRRFDQALAAEVGRAASTGSTLSLLMMDVDCFKAYNDRYGHQKGDECLAAVAAAMERMLRSHHDVSARYGGEEFAAILPDTDLAAAEVVGERIRCAVAALGLPHEASLAKPHVSLSIGIAAGSGSDLTAKALVARADEALYRAKRNGRDRIAADDLSSALELF